MKNRIFIIDDDADFVVIATKYLEEDGFAVGSANNPLAGLKKMAANPPDLVLLDVRMPDMDGLQVCKEIRSNQKLTHIGVIMVSFKSDESDVVLGLGLGADDYVGKPVRKNELLARVKAVLRRKTPEMNANVIELGPFKIDFERYSAWLNGELLKLTPKEFELLGLFMRREGRVLTRGAISEAVWGVDLTRSSRTVDSHVDQLRGKIGSYGACITGLKGVGYRFELEE